MFEAEESLCLQALPPASFHGASRAVCLGKHTPVVHHFRKEALWQCSLVPESPAPIPFHQPLPLPEPESPAGLHALPGPPGLVHPFWPWHFLLLLSGRPFSSPPTW